MTTVVGKLVIEVRYRWWFGPARLATIALIRLGLIRDTDRAAEWIVRRCLVIIPKIV
ncbi:MAG TPA: hypothetical protein VNH53_03835 [Sphingomicrobium sp.]|nr:hypothetical protein [Sphingomicrobium sp.]